MAGAQFREVLWPEGPRADNRVRGRVLMKSNENLMCLKKTWDHRCQHHKDVGSVAWFVHECMERVDNSHTG
jgi:hypothetical protein